MQRSSTRACRGPSPCLRLVRKDFGRRVGDSAQIDNMDPALVRGENMDLNPLAISNVPSAPHPFLSLDGVAGTASVSPCYVGSVSENDKRLAQKPVNTCHTCQDHIYSPPSQQTKHPPSVCQSATSQENHAACVKTRRHETDVSCPTTRLWRSSDDIHLQIVSFANFWKHKGM